MRRFLCGVPDKDCCGTEVQVNAGLYGYRKVHSSTLEAFECHKRHLVRQGFIPVGERELLTPPDADGRQFIRVLPKKSKFGAVLRQGKRGDKMASGNRWVPAQGKRMKSGIVINC